MRTTRSHVVALVTARGGSKGIPHKNVRLVAGKPLIAWTLDAASRSQAIDRVIVSTDSPEIANVAIRFGAEVPFLRPPELALDHSSHLDVALHALEWLENHSLEPVDYLVTLQPTSPLRVESDMDGAVKLAQQSDADAVIGVCEAEAHPYLMHQRASNGVLTPFITTDRRYLRRQDLPTAYRINGAVYVHQAWRLLANRVWFPSHVVGYVMPAKRSLDIDTEWDLKVADYLLRESNHVRQAA
jgi:CMP-N-acetylneuraminic acid synthetase